MNSGTHEGQRRACNPVKLELKIIMSNVIFMLGTELRFSGRAIQTPFTAEPLLQPLNCFVIVVFPV